MIESEKAEIEIEAPESGVLRHVYIEGGTTVPCGTLLAALTATADEAFDPEAFRRTIEVDRPRRMQGRPDARARPLAQGVTDAARLDAVPVTPAARRRATVLAVDTARVVGSGPGGESLGRTWRPTRRSSRHESPYPTGWRWRFPVLATVYRCSCSQDSVQVCLPPLAKRYRVLGVNPRGVGLSDAPPTDSYDIATAAADAAIVAGGPAHLVGASLGAAVALELALTRPALVRSLTLVTPFVRMGARLTAVIDVILRHLAGTDADPAS